MEKFVKTKLGAAGFYTKQKNCRISITKIIVSEKFDKTKKCAQVRIRASSQVRLNPA
jgi:hypothetical protein